jgi:hypothetical protein
MFKRLTVTNTLAYYDEELTTAVKSFIVETLGLKVETNQKAYI